MTNPDAHSRVAVVTGASSGIGEATAKTLGALGFHVVAVARRADRIQRLADEIGGTSVVADVTDDDAVAALAAGLPRVDVLVNNAGGAKGLEPIAEANLDNWRWMWETNVLGTLRVTRALLPKLVESGDGLIVTVTSIAALEVYDNGGGYTAAKHAQGALHRTLRGELLGKTGAAHRDCAWRGGDGVLPGALRRRRTARRRGLLGDHTTGGRRRRGGDRLRRVAPVACQPGPDRAPAPPRSSQRQPVQPPVVADRDVVGVVVVGVPDSVGASVGVAGAVLGGMLVSGF